MRRLLGILMNMAAALSLLLCVATVAVWLWSYRVRDEVKWESFDDKPGGGVGRNSWVASARGGVNFRRNTLNLNPGVQMRFPPLRHETRPAVAYPRITSGALGWWNRLGFWWQNEVLLPSGVTLTDGTIDYFNRGGTERRLTLPYWSIALVFAVMPARVAITSRRRRRARRAATNLCPACGYDLRATSDRCPECGATSQGATA